MNIVSAKKAAEFSKIQKTDRRGRVTSVLVPGHRGAWYEVLIRRHMQKGTQVVSAQCTCVVDKSPCKGNSHNICYHSLAAIIAGADKIKVHVSFCKTKVAAEKLTNIGGTCHIVRSRQSEKDAWMVIK